MSLKHFELPEDQRKMLIEVIEHVRKQEYTPEMLCEKQKIIDTQHYYWWINDLKIEERGNSLFTEEFDAYCTGHGDYRISGTDWARNAKYCNSFVNSLHMGHNPMIWFMDATHARGIFLFESHFTYLDNSEEKVELFIIYCDDFVKKEDNQWYISHYRLYNIKSDGEHRPEILIAPEDFKLPDYGKVE